MIGGITIVHIESLLVKDSSFFNIDILQHKTKHQVMESEQRTIDVTEYELNYYKRFEKLRRKPTTN